MNGMGPADILHSLGRHYEAKKTLDVIVDKVLRDCLNSGHESQEPAEKVLEIDESMEASLSTVKMMILFLAIMDA